MKYITIIERYFFGELSERELKEFSVKLSQDDEFSREFELYKSVFDSLNSNDKKEAEEDKLHDFQQDPDILDLIEKYSTKEPLSESEKDLKEKIQKNLGGS